MKRIKAGWALSWRTGKSRREGERGVTLIELFVALMVAGILGVIIFAVITSQSRAYAIQERMTYMQQSLRIAMAFLKRDVAMAGFGTAGSAITDAAIGVGGQILAVHGIEGGAGKPDVLQVLFAEPSKVVNIKSGQGCTTSTLCFEKVGDEQNFLSAEYMLCFGYSPMTGMYSYLFKLVGYDPNTGTLSEGSYSPDTGCVNISVPVNPSYTASCAADDVLPDTLQCAPSQINTYFIDSESSDGAGAGTSAHPVLMMSSSIQAINGDDELDQADGNHTNDVAIADNIEDLQLQVCRSTVSERCDESDFEDWNATFSSSSIVQNIQQLRINLTVRSDRRAPDGASMGEVNPLTEEIDGYFHRSEVTQVLIRNLRYPAMRPY